ncbi:MAG: EVE domain-containing protein [Myxococcales bacterium]
MPKRHWLLKTEPDVFSFDDLLAAPGRTAGWDGVRNFQARNFLRDEMRPGDGVLIYHSRIAPMAVVGQAEVVRAGHPDPTQFEKGSDHHDPRAKPDAPIWFQVDVRAVAALRHPVTLERMKATAELRSMALLRRGNRLSVQPVSAEEFRCVLRLGRAG